jgi:hypothetical protein
LWKDDLHGPAVVLGGLEDLPLDFERRAAEADDVLDVEDAVGVLATSGRRPCSRRQRMRPSPMPARGRAGPESRLELEPVGPEHAAVVSHRLLLIERSKRALAENVGAVHERAVGEALRSQRLERLAAERITGNGAVVVEDQLSVPSSRLIFLV